MMYSDETIASLGLMTKYGRGVIENVLNALEATEEQQRLRADADATCEWWNDGEMWESSCGVAYMFNSDGPEDNGHRFCHKCGKRIALEEAREA